MSQWVSVKDRLPDAKHDHNESGARLFWVTDGKNCISAWFVAELGLFGANGVMFTAVTHWMDPPLPQPPQQEVA